MWLIMLGFGSDTLDIEFDGEFFTVSIPFIIRVAHTSKILAFKHLLGN